MKLIFLDRDGVINEYPGHGNYVTSWEEFRFIPGAKAALKKLNASGFKIAVISNQAGVGKGEYSQAELDRITKNMLSALDKEGIKLSGVYYCTHRREEQCSCRKPLTGMIKQAVEDAGGGNIDYPKLFFIGDSLVDVQTGRNAGMKTILVFSGREKKEDAAGWDIQPDFTANDLSGAVSIVLKQKG